LQRKGCEVVFYNSWENDLLENPFIPLTQEIINASVLDNEKYKQLIKALHKAAVGVISNYNIITKIIYKTYKNFKNDKETNVLLQQYKQTKDLINRFKDSLANVALKLESPLVIVIDELDRCRPDYAVKTLETIKHFFDIDNIVFVLAMDRKQIESTIGVLYGVKIEENSSEYLRKFIDQDFYLPKPNSKEYLKFLCERYLKEIVRPFCDDDRLVILDGSAREENLSYLDQSSRNNFVVERVLRVMTKYLELMSSYYGFSLRAQEQLIKKIQIFISSLDLNNDVFAPEIIVIFNSAHLFDKSMFERFKDENNREINYFLLPSSSETMNGKIEKKGGDLKVINKFHNKYYNNKLESGEKDPINLWSDHIRHLRDDDVEIEDCRLNKISVEVIEKYLSLIISLNVLDKTNQELRTKYY
jgi:hypothetical protein